MTKLSAMRDAKVQICILTYKRPALLEAALKSVCDQQFTDQPRPQLSVLVVDNDDMQSGREAFEKVYGVNHPAARYVVATPKGIAHARNRALDESVHADFIVFLDDDEWASPLWLQALLNTQRRFDADVVTGPVIPVLEHAPEWLIRSYKSCQYGCQTYETGAPIKFLGNGNTLVRMSVTRDVRFDRRFDHTGLEDADYFLRLRGRGARIVFAKEAKAYEAVPEHRATAQWLLQRGRWRTNAYTNLCLCRDPGITTIAARLLKAAAAFTVGVVLLPTAVAGKYQAIRALHWIYRAAGTVDALRGKVYYHQM